VILHDLGLHHLAKLAKVLLELVCTWFVGGAVQGAIKAEADASVRKRIEAVKLAEVPATGCKLQLEFSRAP
jgi:hypothetical protein